MLHRCAPALRTLEWRLVFASASAGAGCVPFFPNLPGGLAVPAWPSYARLPGSACLALRATSPEETADFT